MNLTILSAVSGLLLLGQAATPPVQGATPQGQPAKPPAKRPRMGPMGPQPDQRTPAQKAADAKAFQEGRAVNERLIHFIQSCRSLAIDFTLSSSSSRVKGPGNAKMVYVRPNKLCYTFNWVGIDYRFVGDPHGCWDANYNDKVYDDEYSQWGFWYPYSNISGANGIFMPGFAMDGTLHSDEVPGVRYIGKARVDGVETDEVEGRNIAAKFDLYLDAAGRPVRYVKTRLDSGLAIQADVKSIAANQPEPEGLFANNPPLGFTEYALPYQNYPLHIGALFPLKGWSSKQGTSLGALFMQKPTLVLLTQEGCEPSEESAASLGHLSSSGSINVAVVTLSKSGATPAGLSRFPTVFDPSGKLDQTIGGPGTPFFFLVGNGGKVVKEWYGYDRADAAGFEKDVLASLKAGPSS